MKQEDVQGAGGAVMPETASGTVATTPTEGLGVRHIAILDTDVMVPAVRPAYGQYYSAQYIKLLGAAAKRLDVLHRVRFTAWDVVSGRYPDPADVDAIVITGSIAAAYDTDPWVLALGAFVERVYTAHPDVRIFGTCFGHQLIGQVLLGPHGAVVEKDPNGYEFGVQTIALNRQLVADFPCLGVLDRVASVADPAPRGLRLQMCHGDHVALPQPPEKLPGGWMSVGGTEHCRVQGLYKPSRVLTMQPHFECDQVIMEETIKYFYTPEKGFSEEFLKQAFAATRKEDDAAIAAECVLRFLANI